MIYYKVTYQTATGDIENLMMTNYDVLNEEPRDGIDYLIFEANKIIDPTTHKVDLATLTIVEKATT